MADSGWFAARPSGTEDIYKIYGESFPQPGPSAPRAGGGAGHGWSGRERLIRVVITDDCLLQPLLSLPTIARLKPSPKVVVATNRVYIFGLDSFRRLQCFVSLRKPDMDLTRSENTPLSVRLLDIIAARVRGGSFASRSRIGWLVCAGFFEPLEILGPSPSGYLHIT